MLYFRNNENQKHNVVEKEVLRVLREHDLITSIDGNCLFPPCLFFIDLMLSRYLAKFCNICQY
jgi:hypothetical protein